jgi:hypothetical protein
MWTNKINGKIYIGSSVDLRIRLRCYFSAGYLERQTSKSKSLIYSSLLKNGYENFRLEILKYCSPEKCIKWEQFYIDLLKPEYNILQIAGSSLGYKHSEEILAKMSGKNSPMFGKTGEKHHNSLKIVVTDLELNTKTTFGSISEAARALNINQKTISNYFIRNQKKPYKGRYVFTKI